MNPLTKLELYAIAAGVLVLAVLGAYAFGHHSGWSDREDKDAAAIIELQDKAAAESERLRDKAHEAEHVHDQELVDLRTYRFDHPLHGGLCLSGGPGDLPETGAGDAHDGGAGAGAPAVQSLHPGDTGTRRSADPDVRHLLDLFAGRADQVSAQLREWQTH